MMNSKKKSVTQIKHDKERKIMETVAWRAGYYRANPQRFVRDVLGIALKWFQAIILYAMMHDNYIMYIAARGQGKTWLTALFCCVRGILYPKTTIVVCSGTLKQANEVLLKIQDKFMNESWFLRNEISKCNIGQNDAYIEFKNGSKIMSRVSNENTRSARANIIIVDEFRMVDENILNTVLRKLITTPRQPKYLEKPEYEHMQERNKEIYMSSAYFKSSWAYRKAQGYTVNFFNDKKKYFICGLPYELSIREGLLSREQVLDEMSEVGVNEMLQAMEMECMWYGDDGDSLFKYEDINNRRRIKNAYYPLEFYNDRVKVPPLADRERRIMSVDVALMATSKKKKNDAASMFINSAIQADDTSYQSNYVYTENYEGMTTDELGITIMREFYNYHCTDLVLDTNGLGIGVYDYIIKDRYDETTGQTYKALTCVNDDEMAKRCKVADANHCVWSIKANAAFNSNIAIALRTGIQTGKISFLISDQDAEDVLKNSFKGYKHLSIAQKDKLKMPYIQTTMAEYELIKLKSEVKNGNIKVEEISGMRKDRYSSLAYNNWCVNQLAYNLTPIETTEDLIAQLATRISRGKYAGHSI